MNTGGVSLGVLNFFDQQRQQKQQELQQQLLQQQIEGVTRSRQVAESSGRALGDMFSQQDDQLPQAPAPGQASVAAGGPAAAAQPPASAGAPAPQMAPSPYKSYDDHVAANKQQQTTPDALPAAPTPAAAPADTVTAKQPKQRDLGEFVRTLKRNGVPDWQVFESVKEMFPVLNATNTAQLNALKIHADIAQKESLMFYREMKVDLAQQKINNDKQKAEADQAYKDRKLDEAMRMDSARIEGINANVKMQLQSFKERAKNDDQKAAYQKMTVLHQQMSALESAIKEASNPAINGTSAQREANERRVVALRAEYDALNKRYDAEVDGFTNAGVAYAHEQAGTTADRPTGYTAKPGDKSAARPAKPTDPKYDYKFDEQNNQWLRSPKQ
jgi:hypothetical protein